MSENIIADLSSKIETAKQQAEAAFSKKIKDECLRIDKQQVTVDNVTACKEACYQRWGSNAENQLQKAVLASLKKKKHLKLKDSFFEKDDYLIPLLDNDALPPEFNGSIRDLILIPASFQAALLSRLKFRYCLVPFISIVSAVILFWAIPSAMRLFIK